MSSDICVTQLGGVFTVLAVQTSPARSREWSWDWLVEYPSSIPCRAIPCHQGMKCSLQSKLDWVAELPALPDSSPGFSFMCPDPHLPIHLADLKAWPCSELAWDILWLCSCVALGLYIRRGPTFLSCQPGVFPEICFQLEAHTASLLPASITSAGRPVCSCQEGTMSPSSQMQSPGDFFPEMQSLMTAGRLSWHWEATPPQE